MNSITGSCCCLFWPIYGKKYRWGSLVNRRNLSLRSLIYHSAKCLSMITSAWEWKDLHMGNWHNVVFTLLMGLQALQCYIIKANHEGAILIAMFLMLDNE